MNIRRPFRLSYFLPILIALISTVTAYGRPYLLLYAFDEEGAAFARMMTVSHTDTVLGRIVQSGLAGGKEVILAESGIGMTNAAMTTQRLIDRYQPEAVIFTGIAGAVDSAVHIGDIVIASTWIQHDFGYIGAEGFQRNGIGAYNPAVDSVVRMSEFPVDPRLLEIARDATQGRLALDSIGARVPTVTVGGVGASGNTFIDNSEKRVWLSRSVNAKIVDMESAAVVQVCTANGVSVIVMRSASDLAGGSGSSTAHAELDRFFRVAAANSSITVMALLRRLPEALPPTK